ncbi:MAG: response regulator receiver modulated CheB methylesterase, partial [Gemmatimonadetes bacterium]|nr:response regulator receiver modulated CheB methylesterase [Gemmatimonadota bacterium]
RALRAAARARPRAGALAFGDACPRDPSPSPSASGRPGEGWNVVAVGASTGGTEALHAVLGALPADGPCILVAQHMPPGFTQAFARSLDACGALEVREAAGGEEVRPGLALVAPGDGHLRVERVRGRLVTRVERGGRIEGVRPSVDALFRSVAAAAGAEAVGVLLTGMGADGAEGLLEMRRAGAHTVAQDEATSVVWGMPGAAAARGAAAEVLPLDRIPAALLRAARRRPAAVGAR